MLSRSAGQPGRFMADKLTEKQFTWRPGGLRYLETRFKAEIKGALAAAEEQLRNRIQAENKPFLTELRA